MGTEELDLTTSGGEEAIRQGFTKVKSDGRYIGGMRVHRGRKHTNLIKVKINGNFQSEFELGCKNGSEDSHFDAQLSIKSNRSAQSYHRRSSFSSKSLSGMKLNDP